MHVTFINISTCSSPMVWSSPTMVTEAAVETLFNYCYNRSVPLVILRYYKTLTWQTNVFICTFSLTVHFQIAVKINCTKYYCGQPGIWSPKVWRYSPIIINPQGYHEMILTPLCVTCVLKQLNVFTCTLVLSILTLIYFYPMLLISVWDSSHLFSGNGGIHADHQSGHLDGAPWGQLQRPNCREPKVIHETESGYPAL